MCNARLSCVTVLRKHLGVAAADTSSILCFEANCAPEESWHVILRLIYIALILFNVNNQKLSKRGTILIFLLLWWHRDGRDHIKSSRPGSIKHASGLASVCMSFIDVQTGKASDMAAVHVFEIQLFITSEICCSSVSYFLVAAMSASGGEKTNPLQKYLTKRMTLKVSLSHKILKYIQQNLSKI